MQVEIASTKAGTETSVVGVDGADTLKAAEMRLEPIGAASDRGWSCCGYLGSMPR